MLQPSLLHDSPSRIRRMAIAGVSLLVFSVVGYRIVATILPPPLVIAAPADQLTTSSRMVIIRGETAPGAALSVNGRSFVPDAAGGFALEVVLQPGMNTIELEARTRHSRPARIIRHVRVMTAEGPVA